MLELGKVSLETDVFSCPYSSENQIIVATDIIRGVLSGADFHNTERKYSHFSPVFCVAIDDLTIIIKKAFLKILILTF